MCARVRTCAGVHTCVCVYVNKEKAPSLGHLLTPYSHKPFIRAKILFKSHVGLCSRNLSVQVMWPHEERLICV